MTMYFCRLSGCL